MRMGAGATLVAVLPMLPSDSGAVGGIQLWFDDMDNMSSGATFDVGPSGVHGIGKGGCTSHDNNGNGNGNNGQSTVSNDLNGDGNGNNGNNCL